MRARDLGTFGAWCRLHDRFLIHAGTDGGLHQARQGIHGGPARGGGAIDVLRGPAGEDPLAADQQRGGGRPGRSASTTLHASGVLADDDRDYLAGAFHHITNLVLRQQIRDFEAGAPVGNHVAPEAMTRRERDMLVDAFRAIRRFRKQLQVELTGQMF